jgi:hypothetical protein
VATIAASTIGKVPKLRFRLLVLDGVLLAATACAVCVLVFPLLPRQESWSFVESVGGIAVGTPQRMGQIWVLPIEADISGLRNITTKATRPNSGIVCKEVTASVKDRNIYLTLVTQPAGLGLGGVAECPPTTRLGRMRAGKYTVLYAGPWETPHVIGSISIEPSASSAGDLVLPIALLSSGLWCGLAGVLALWGSSVMQRRGWPRVMFKPGPRLIKLHRIASVGLVVIGVALLAAGLYRLLIST